MSKAHMRPAAQRGFSMFFTLIALVILLVATVSIMRSSGMSLFSSGNIAFKQDMVSRAEQVNARVLTLFRTGGGLEPSANRSVNDINANYSATALQVNDQGIPLALINDTSFAAVGKAANDIVDADSGTTMRYLIERLCDQTGDAVTLGKPHCVYDPDSKPITGGSSTSLQAGAMPVSFSPLYRVTVRVQGPRGSEAYTQSTFIKPN